MRLTKLLSAFPGACLFLTFVVIFQIKAQKIYVCAENGSDTFEGSFARPYATITRAAKDAYPGDTVFVRGGVYRERVAPPRQGIKDAPIVYMAKPGDSVYIKGSDVWDPVWEKHPDYESIYSSHPDANLFTDSVHIDGGNTFELRYHEDAELKYTLGQIFVDHERYWEKETKSEMIAKTSTWYYDTTAAAIYVHFPPEIDPQKALVEITVRRRIFAPHKRGLDYITVSGFIMEHCGNRYPSGFYLSGNEKRAQAGALGCRSGSHWLIENNTIRYATGIGIDCGREADGDIEEKDNGNYYSTTGNTIRHNAILYNGSGAIMGILATHCVIEENLVMGNNCYDVDGAETCGIKMHVFRSGTIRKNMILNNKGPGIYLDNRYENATVSRNYVYGNYTGMFFELYNKANLVQVDNNLVLYNRNAGIFIQDGSGVDASHNLIARTHGSNQWGLTGEAVFIRIVTDRGVAEAVHNSLYNNILIANYKTISIPYENCSNTRAYDNISDYNIYYGDSTTSRFYVNKYCGGEGPWGSDVSSMLEHVYEDLGTSAPDGVLSLSAGSYPAAQLTLQQWQALWQAYDMNNDLHSRMCSDMFVELDTTSFTLMLNLPDQNSQGIYPLEDVDSDFFGNHITDEATARPGPFQDIRYGRNTIDLTEADWIARWMSRIQQEQGKSAVKDPVAACANAPVNAPATVQKIVTGCVRMSSFVLVPREARRVLVFSPSGRSLADLRYENKHDAYRLIHEISRVPRTVCILKYYNTENNYFSSK